MATRSTTNTHHKEFGAVFLLPEDVGSSVRWSVELSQYRNSDGKYGKPSIDAYVALTDCTRTITWSEYDDGQKMLTKLDRAIDELSKARRSLRAAIKAHAKLPNADED